MLSRLNVDVFVDGRNIPVDLLYFSLSLSLFLLRLARDQSWANILFGEHCPREFLHNTYENGEYANSSKIATHAKNTFYIVTNKMSSNIIPMNHLHSLYLHLYFSSCNRECKKKKRKIFCYKITPNSANYWIRRIGHEDICF